MGFAAETSHVVENAKAKLARKGCDLIIANDVSESGAVMGGDSNAAILIGADGVEAWPRLSKQETAARIISVIAKRLVP